MGNAKSPEEGLFWRINFSRVQWGFEIDQEGNYVKEPCCLSCAVPGQAAEDNWVWSKQGEVAMHLPERWGIIQFSKETPSTDVQMKNYDEWPARCAAMAMYYAMTRYQSKESSFTDDVNALSTHSTEPFTICNDAAMSIKLTETGYKASASVGQYTATVNQERYLTVSMKDEDATAPS